MIRGQFEMTDSRRVTGWAFDPEDPSANLRVEVFLDDAKLGEAIAGEGLASSPASNEAGAHPFEIALVDSIASDDWARIRAVITPVVEIDPAAMEQAADRIARFGLFDPPFYGAQIDQPLSAAELLVHYLWRGEREGLAPHPLFDAAHVRPQLERAGVRIGGAGVLAAYLANPALDIDPHPLFDTRRYRRLAGRGETELTALAQYLALDGRGGTDLSSCVLFDPDWYLDVYPDVMRSGVDALVHYVKFGAREGRAPHPLFLASHFRDQLDQQGVAHPPDFELLAFYLNTPLAWSVSPHPLFDPDHYVRTRLELGLPRIEHAPPLAAMLTLDEDIAPGPWFDVAHYRAQASRAGATIKGPSIVHYLRHQARLRLDPHPLFSLRHYQSRRRTPHRVGFEPLTDFVGANAWASGQADVFAGDGLLADAARTLLAKAIRDGQRPSRSSGAGFTDPHPLFESRLYAARDRTCLRVAEEPLAHYARQWGASGYRFPPWGTALRPRRNAPTDHGPFDVIFVTHEVSRTGAPAIILKIIEDLVRRRGVRGLTLAVNGGDRMEEFREWTPVVDLAAIRAAGGSDSAFVEDLVASFSPSSRPSLVLVNTACADHMANAFAAADIPVVTLVHEIASSFPARVFENIYACSERVIYPAQFVCDEAHKAHDLPVSKDAIAPQGLLKPDFGEIDAVRARREVLEEFGLPDNAFIVLGAGTVDLRKGVDVFVRVAAQIERLRTRDGGGPPVHFVWLGEGERRPHSPFGLILEDVRRLGLTDRMHFAGARSNPEPYFVACDAFALTSRLDPFPCVVHEAMACSKPVIAFAGAGGAPEALADGAGVVVDYGDIDAMAAAIWDLARDRNCGATMGKTARARVKERYVFADYVDRLVGLIGDGAGVDLGAPRALADLTSGPGRRVFFTASRWEPSGQTAFVRNLINGLNRRGFDAELVIATRDPILRALEHLPEAPTTVLADSLRRASPLEETWRRLGALLGGSGPAIFVPAFDEIGEALTPTLPRDVGVLAMAFDGEPGLAERAVRLGRYWQRAIALSPQTADALLQFAPGLEGQVETIAWPLPDMQVDGVDAGFDSLCDRYAQVLDDMFTELAEGRYARPRPAFLHPDLGGLSLPPSLVRHPDLN